MKLDNLSLGLALADHAVNHPQQTELMQLADYLLRHPMSRIYYERVLGVLGVDPDTVPSELWGETVPDEAHGAGKLKAAIDNLNAQWGKGKLQRMIAVRNLAWHSTLLARRLEKDLGEGAKRVVDRNGGSTAGLLNAFIAAPATRVELDAIAVQTAPQ